MSTRVVNLKSCRWPVGYYDLTDPLDNRLVTPFGGGPIFEEASPIYTSASTRLRITGGAQDGYDGTATWTRIPIEIDTGTSPSVYADGLDIFPSLYAPADSTKCCFICSHEMASDYAFFYYRDANKQRPQIWAQEQPVTSSGYTISLGPICWYYDMAVYPSYRTPIRYLGEFIGLGAQYGTPSAAVDSASFTAAQWRDLRGSYSASHTDSGVTHQYDWTIG